MSLNEESFKESSSLFLSEFNILEKTISETRNSENLDIAKIVDAYYKVINVTSLAKILKEHLENMDELSESQQNLLNHIENSQNYIQEKFNANLHPKLLQELKNSIDSITKNLQSVSGQKTKEQIQEEAESFKKLREIMSTREFVEQYDKGLN